MIQITGKVAESVVEGLKGQPLALPLVVINIICLVVVGYVLYQVSSATQRRDTLIAELAKSCAPVGERAK